MSTQAIVHGTKQEREAQRMHAEVIRAGAKFLKATAEYAYALRDMRESRFWHVLGYERWIDYLDCGELPCGRSQNFKLLAMLDEAEGPNPVTGLGSEIFSLPTEKAYELIRAIKREPERTEELVDLVRQELPVREFVRLARQEYDEPTTGWYVGEHDIMLRTLAGDVAIARVLVRERCQELIERVMRIVR